MAFSLLKRLKISLLFGLFLVLAGPCPVVFSAATTTNKKQNDVVHHLTVLFTNDSHGHPVKFLRHSVPDVGGLPARSTLVKEVRKTRQNVLLLDAGDINTGQSVSNFFKAKPDILGYNHMGYDAMVLGNHEFDNPVSVLLEQMDLARFPHLSANVKKRNGDLLAIPYIIKRFPGFSVAVMGLTTSETRITGNPDHIKDLIFEDEVDVAQRLVPKLRKKADLVIALTHLGIYETDNRGSRKLASRVPGIDLIVDGETHTKMRAPLIVTNPAGRPTLIVQAWQWGLFLGKIDLAVQNREIVDFDMEMIPINLKRTIKNPDGTKTFEYIGKPIPEDPALLAVLKPYQDKVDQFLSERIGYAKAPFENDRGRHRETALGDLVSDAMLWYLRRFNPDFALTNSGAIRAGIPEGPLTQETIYDILPFDSSLVFFKMEGTRVQALFDFIGTIEPGAGAFPQVSSGVRFTLNTQKRRCENILINGKPIDPEKSYGIVTNSYLAKGGDGYAVFPRTIDQFDSATFQRDALIAYIKQVKGHLIPRVHRRITLLP